MSIQASREQRARELYQRYGGRPWTALPEATRAHYRRLVVGGSDGRGAPLRSR